MTKKPIKFTKMHGLGNDFMMINGISQPLSLPRLPIKKWANRHIGIGFDQLLYLETSPLADFTCRIFNSDGSEAENCGNGLRCLARFIHEENLSTKKTISVELKTSTVTIEMKDFNTIKIEMGVPKFEPDFNLTVENKNFPLSVLSLGNPHAIHTIYSLEEFSVEKYGKHISTHSHFPKGVNVGFMQILNPEHILLRTYERGTGETLACGSNSCAAVVSGIKNKSLKEKVKVELPLGDLIIEWQGDGKPVTLSGPAEKVYEGTVFLD